MAATGDITLSALMAHITLFHKGMLTRGGTECKSVRRSAGNSHLRGSSWMAGLKKPVGQGGGMNSRLGVIVFIYMNEEIPDGPTARVSSTFFEPRRFALCKELPRPTSVLPTSSMLSAPLYFDNIGKRFRTTPLDSTIIFISVPF